MLKNDGILPLNKKKLKTIGVIGPNANSREALIGNYHGTASRYVTVLEGIQDYVGDDVRVLYSEGCHLFLDQVEKLAREDDRISEAMTVAEHSDLVILCLGLDESLEGEEGDTGNAYASGDKQADASTFTAEAFGNRGRNGSSVYCMYDGRKCYGFEPGR